MHIIGFSHHYTKLHHQTYGELLAVRSTKPLGNRPNASGILYDTEYLSYGVRDGEPVTPSVPQKYPVKRYHVLLEEEFDKPMLQLVFIGDKQIPFTTYREFPKDYKPFWGVKTRTYRKSIPYSELIGSFFAFKFKGEKLPEGLANKISGRPGGCVKIFE